MAHLICKLLLFFLYFYKASAEVNGRYYPRYHLAPPQGWMNDPNGFCIFQNEYHLFYQHNPASSQEPGLVHWGHAKSKDLFHWEHLPIGLYPDDWYDKSGVFSGSALVENDTMYLFYTGNLNHPGETPDHEQHQALAISTDGVNITKYHNNPIIYGLEHQPNFRDPKVWEHDGTYYMVLGNSFENDTLGRVLLYSSKDMISWEQVSILDESDGSLGYMYECPDFFELDGRYVLLFSPQGVQPSGDKYRNLYQTGYIVGNFDYQSNLFTPTTEFRELDHGHDIYATQTILDFDRNRIVVAWFDMWDQNYPEKNDGFNGQVTIPRVLRLTPDGHLIQKPVKQIAAAKGRLLYNGKSRAGTNITLDDKAGEVTIKASRSQDFELHVQGEESGGVIIRYDYLKGQVTLDRGGEDGIRRTKWRPQGKLRWRIFIDASSIELFCGDGEVTFSSRFFPNGKVTVCVANGSHAEKMTVHAMKRTVYVPPEEE